MAYERNQPYQGSATMTVETDLRFKDEIIRRPPIVENFVVMKQVLGALILRDMRTRFGRMSIGFLMWILIPFLHILLVVIIYRVLGRTAPIGTDTITFLTLGVIPFIMCVYPFRQIARAVIINRPLLYFPRVRLLDIIIARAALEIVAAVAVCVIVIGVLVILGFEFRPFDVARMILGFALALYFGIALGFVVAVMSGVWAPALFAVVISSAMWGCSGVFFIPDNLPELAREVAAYNPLLHCIELVRVGYYGDYVSRTLDVSYAFWFTTAMIAFGLIMQFMLKGVILSRH